MLDAQRKVTANKEILNKSWWATFNRIPTSGAAKNWIDRLVEQTLEHEAKHHPRPRERKQKDLVSFKAAIGAFAADLLYHNRNEKSQGFMYRPFDRVELSFTLVSGTSFGKLITYWTELGWMERTGHIKSTDDWEGHEIDGYSKARRYRGTQAFLDGAQSFQLTPTSVSNDFEASHRHATLVQLRASKKNSFKTAKRGKTVRAKGPQFDAQLATMRNLNQLMQNHAYSLTEPPMIRRMFNCVDREGFDFDLGGRFYGSSGDNWMEMSKEERKLITVDGQPTYEIDVSASHLSILYALSGKPIPSDYDLYGISEYPREIVKQVIVAAIGSGKLPTRWPVKFNEDYEKKHGRRPSSDYKLKEVVAAVVKRHPILKTLKKDHLDWANLQYEESECFLAAMLDLHENHGIASLPIHDSLIVRQSDMFVAYGIDQITATESGLRGG